MSICFVLLTIPLERNRTMRFDWMTNRLEPAGSRKLRKTSPSLESLEGRALMSGVPGYPTSPSPPIKMPTIPTPITTPTVPKPITLPTNPSPITTPANPTPITVPASPTPQHAATPTTPMPGKAPTGHSSHASKLPHKPSGIVTKVPHFYKFYTGPKWAELNAMKASAELSPNGDFTFTGTNEGRINKTPAVYVWGIDRNGNLPAGPFTGRPNIRFDAVVVVSLDSSLTPTASVTDLATGTTTNLPAGSASIHGRKVTVTVPGSLLPSTGLAPSQFRFNYWPEDGGPPVSSSVASFAPENTTAQVGTTK